MPNIFATIVIKAPDFWWKKFFYSIRDRERNDLCKCQLKPGSLTDIPFLVRTSALLNHIIPFVSDHLQ